MNKNILILAKRKICDTGVSKCGGGTVRWLKYTSMNQTAGMYLESFVQAETLRTDTSYYTTQLRTHIYQYLRMNRKKNYLLTFQTLKRTVRLMYDGASGALQDKLFMKMNKTTTI